MDVSRCCSLLPTDVRRQLAFGHSSPINRRACKHSRSTLNDPVRNPEPATLRIADDRQLNRTEVCGTPCRAALLRFSEANYTPTATLTEDEVAQALEPFGGSAGRHGKGLTANDLHENQGWRRGECIPLDDLPI